jgi:molecular chaperone GrpE
MPITDETMKKDERALSDPFRVTETPIATSSWSAADAAYPVETIANDLTRFARNLAELDFSLKSAQDKNSKDKAALFLEMLEVVDGFERVFLNIQKKQDLVTPQMKKWIGNFRAVYRVLQDVLSQHGVTRIENLEQGFDPAWHKAVEIVSDPLRPEGTIAEEITAGYLWNDIILRKSGVAVVRHSTNE